MVPLVETDGSEWHIYDARRFQSLTFNVFCVAASARVAAQYPTHANELRAYADFAAAAARAAADAADAANATASAFYGYANSAADSANYAAVAAHAAATARASHPSRIAGDAINAATTIFAVVSNDANFIALGGAANVLASEPLWPDGAPRWAGYYWKHLQDALPRKGDWQVWIDWYNRRLEGVSDPEEVELLFATVPDKERTAGPAAANKGIKRRLEELQKKELAAVVAGARTTTATHRKPPIALHFRSQRRRTDHNRRGAAKYAGPIAFPARRHASPLVGDRPEIDRAPSLSAICAGKIP